MKNFISLLIVTLLSTTSLWAQDIVAAEYYIDTDAGFGQNVSIPLDESDSDITQSFTVDLTDISEGPHTLWIRVKDDQGRWSIVTSRAFLVVSTIPEEGSILAAEYFIDEDQGFGNNRPIPLSSIGSDITITFAIDLSGYTPGIHMLYARTMDVKGKWSIAAHMPFVVVDSTELNDIIALEYYYYSIADEAIVGSDTLTYRFSEPKASINEPFVADVSALTNEEEYILYVWAVDQAGRRSLASTTQFKYCNNLNGECRPPLAIDSLVVTNIGCQEDELGQVEIVASGGGNKSDYTYSLDNTNFVESNVFTDLREGNYTAYVKTGEDTVSEEFVIRSATSAEDCPDPVRIELETTNTTCAENTDGEVTITVAGEGDFTYSLDGSIYIANNVFTGLAPGEYTAYARSEDTTLTEKFEILAPDPIVLTLGSITSPTCTQPESGSFAVAASGGSETTYSYRIGNGATQTSGTFSGLTAGEYTVTAEDANGCEATLAVTVPGDAAAPATPVIELQANADPEALATEVILVVNNVSGTFTWYRDGVEIAGETTNQLTLTDGGAYTVVVTNAEGCPSAVSGSFEVTSVADDWEEGVVVFPNPVQAELRVTLPPSARSTTEVAVYNLQGQALLQQTFPRPQAIRLNTEGLSTGTYLLRISSSDAVIQRKIQKY